MSEQTIVYSTAMNQEQELEKGEKEYPRIYQCFPLTNIYDLLNGFLNKYIFSSDKSTDTKPIFSKNQRWNIFLYIIGIMCYKFALESYMGSVRSLAIDRFTSKGYPVYTWSGYLDGFGSSAQCVGAIIVGPLMQFFPLKSVLFGSMFFLCLISTIIMIVEGSTGGKFPTDCKSIDGLPPKCTGAIAGDWDPRGILPVFVFAGIPYGCIELIRRIIPQQLVGGNEFKLKKLDSLVHMYYEIAGTGGAFFASYVSLTNGKAFAPIISPPLFFIAATIWCFIVPPTKFMEVLNSTNGEAVAEGNHVSFTTKGVLVSIGFAFVDFWNTLRTGCKIILFDKRFTWLIFGYSVPLVMHRYIENGVCYVYAKLVLGESAYGPFIVGGSNFGELCGAFVVFMNLNTFPTPIPLLRWDACALNFTWLFQNVVTPATIHANVGITACTMAAIMAFISAGWAAGDVSLSAFIQSNISSSKVIKKDPEMSKRSSEALAAVMSFLYVTYIVIYAIISPMIGHWLDDFYLRSADAKAAGNKAEAAAIEQDAIDEYFYWIAGVWFSLTSVLIFASTFYPPGSWALNPQKLECLFDLADVVPEETEDVVKEDTNEND